jgi:hypothetical protein
MGPFGLNVVLTFTWLDDDAARWYHCTMRAGWGNDW